VERVGVGDGRTAKVGSSPRRPLFIWINRRTGLSSPKINLLHLEEMCNFLVDKFLTLYHLEYMSYFLIFLKK
jgi:hypothetical protein